MNTQCFTFCSVVLVSLTTGSAIVSAAEFTPLGELPGGRDNSVAYGVSGDGKVVFGKSESSTGHHAFKWTEATGMVPLERPTGVNEANALQSNYDGSVIVGNGSGGAALIWSSGGMQKIEGMRSMNAVSADGSLFVGNSCCPKSTLWTEQDGIHEIGSLPGYSGNGTARDVSADGAVVVGIAGKFSGPGQAYLWSETDEFEGLGFIDGSNFSFAEQISADGSTIVGYGDSNSGSQAFRWTRESGMVALGDLPGGSFGSWGYGVSGDGALVVGSARCSAGDCAFLWDAEHGMRDLNDLLVNEYGLDEELNGWQLSEAWGISDDGNVIVGKATNPDGDREAWRVALSTSVFDSCDIDQSGTCNLADIDELMYTGLASTDLATYDLNGDGTIDLGDRDEWFRQAGSLPGDANLDGVNNTQDLNAIGTSWQATGVMSIANGDNNGDGDVNAEDLNNLGVWWTNTAADFADVAMSEAAAVPEPTGEALFLTALLGWVALRHKQQMTSRI